MSLSIPIKRHDFCQTPLYNSRVTRFKSSTISHKFVVILAATDPQPLVCKVGTVSKTSDCQPEGPGFNPRLGRGLNFGCPSFATPSVDRDVKPLV